MLLAELRRMPDPIPKRSLLALLSAYQGARFYVKYSALRFMRVEFARQQLRAGADRVTTMRRVRERYQVSEPTAYRLIRAALEQGR